MPATNAKTRRIEARRDCRYSVPVLEVAIGEWRFRSINWSMGGLLLDGICKDIGGSVRGTIAVSGSREAMPFVATVVRVDPELGSCAICFEHPRAARFERDDNPFAERLH